MSTVPLPVGSATLSHTAQRTCQLACRVIFRSVSTNESNESYPWAVGRDADRHEHGALRAPCLCTLVAKPQSAAGGRVSIPSCLSSCWGTGTRTSAELRTRYPDVRIRLVGQNSAQRAQVVASGALEAGLVMIPVEGEGLDILPLARDELLYVTASAERARSKRSKG
ncbi:LysR substrate-binding domain-containing protein [Streptomyces sp. NPDC056002]|uniref:LysR substrate-binding domain-containing protein n=1 Tax=Streptomyces sp. NPDC056002 TaxID=3345675 RepID=UPI0035D6C462